MIDEEKNRQISEFVEVTQASPDEAQDILESCNWDVQEALSMFYRGNDGDDDDSAGRTVGGGRPSGGVPLPRHDSSRSATPPSSSSRKSGGNKKFATFADLSTDQDEAVQSEDEDKRKEDLFAGGETSGLAVHHPDNNPLGPSNNNNRLLNEIFRRAAQGDPRRQQDDEQEMNLQDARRQQEQESERQRRLQQQYSGAGHVLGSEEVPSREIPAQQPRNVQQPAEKVVRELTFWKDGFSVGDGPLYRYDDPNNVGYLESINAGQAPLALLDVLPSQQVDVHIKKKMDEEYKAPKASEGGFFGEGQRLGSPVAVATNAPAAPVPAAVPAAPAAQASSSSSSSSSAANQPEGEGSLMVMLRLANGKAVKRRVNADTPISELYATVESHHPPPSGRQFVLQTTFPNKEYTDREQTVGDAKLANAVLVQKLT